MPEQCKPYCVPTVILYYRNPASAVFITETDCYRGGRRCRFPRWTVVKISVQEQRMYLELPKTLCTKSDFLKCHITTCCSKCNCKVMISDTLEDLQTMILPCEMSIKSMSKSHSSNCSPPCMRQYKGRDVWRALRGPFDISTRAVELKWQLPQCWNLAMCQTFEQSDQTEPWMVLFGGWVIHD